jgi:hypothetical protein
LFGGAGKALKVTAIDETIVKGAKQAVGGVQAPGTLAGGMARARPGAGKPVGVTNAPETNVQVDVKATPGMNEERLGQSVAREVSKVIDKQNRAAINALVPARAGVE